MSIYYIFKWIKTRQTCLCYGLFLIFCRIREVATSHKVVEQELAHAVNASAAVLSEAFPSKPSSPEVRQRYLQACVNNEPRWVFLYMSCMCAERYAISVKSLETLFLNLYFSTNCRVAQLWLGIPLQIKNEWIKMMLYCSIFKVITLALELKGFPTI